MTHFGPAYLRLQWSHATHASIDEEIIIHPTVRPALASSQACAPGLHGTDLSCGVSQQSPAIKFMLRTCCPQVVEPEYLFHDSCQPKAPSHVPGPPILAPPPRPPPPAPVVHSPPPPPPHAAGTISGALSDAACWPTTTNAQAAPDLPGLLADIKSPHRRRLPALPPTAGQPHAHSSGARLPGPSLPPLPATPPCGSLQPPCAGCHGQLPAKAALLQPCGPRAMRPGAAAGTPATGKQHCVDPAGRGQYLDCIWYASQPHGSRGCSANCFF